jgi:hypothetical protein
MVGHVAHFKRRMTHHAANPLHVSTVVSVATVAKYKKALTKMGRPMRVHPWADRHAVMLHTASVKYGSLTRCLCGKQEKIDELNRPSRYSPYNDRLAHFR